MKKNTNNLKIAAILAMIFSIIIFIIAVVYIFISNLSLVWIIFLIIISVVEIIVFLVSLAFLFNTKENIFFVGLLSLFAGLIPGLIILIHYFKAKKKLVKNLDLEV